MHNLSGVSLRIAAVLGLGAVAAVVGCHDFGEPHAGRVTPIDSATIRRVHARLLAQVMAAESDTGRCSTLNNNCTVTVTETPANYQAPDQTSPITATFSKPIYRLIVMGSGAFQCSGAYGRVTVYNRTYNLYGGWQVEQRDFLLDDPSDCGYDNVTCCDSVTLQFSGGISKVVIDPPQPWEFPVPTSDTTPPATGHVWINYFYSFYQERPATAPCPTGDELLDQQGMRDMLLAEVDSSNMGDVPSNRREVKGFLFEDSTGALAYSVYRDQMNTPCKSWGSPPSMLGVLVAESHSHPFAARDTLFPPICGFTTLQRYDTANYGGASLPDVRAMQTDSLPFYIVDKHNVYVYPPAGVTPRNAKSKVRVYPRVDPATGCTRV